MDTITHGIVGALAGKAFFAGRDVPAGSAGGGQAHAESSPTARAAIVACTLGSMFPDIDVFGGPIARNPLAIIEWHRNITHSLVMLPVWALLLAALSLPLARWVGWMRPSFAKLAVIYAVGLGTHLFLDVVTNFGTMIWSPLNYSRVAWDWFFIVDFTFTGIALVPQLAAWCYREPEEFERRAIVAWGALTLGVLAVFLLARDVGYAFSGRMVGVASATMAAIIFLPAFITTRTPTKTNAETQVPRGFLWKRSSWCRAGFVGLCGYLALAATAHHSALAYTEQYAATNHLQVQALAALPLPPTLTQWSGLILTPQGIWRTTFRVPGGETRSQLLYSETLSDPHIEDAKQLRDVQKYLWFARFPLWRVEQHGAQTAVEITDVRFFRDAGIDESAEAFTPERGARQRANPAGFTFEVVFNGDGRVIYQGFKPPEP